MILGRNRLLWMGLVAAILNVGVVVLHVALDAAQIAALNAGALAVFGFLANEQDPTTVPTFAMSVTPKPAK